MITLRFEHALFSALRAGFEAAAYGGTTPINVARVRRLQSALDTAAANAPPRKPFLVMLESVDDLYALGDYFSVGGEGHPKVTEAHWDAINEVIDQASS